MARYVASINMFEGEDHTVGVSLKVFRVYDFGARPQRPVWSDYVTLEGSTALTPREWLAAVLGSHLGRIDG